MSAGPHGVLVVDKPSGPTSHDVVAWARRALGTRSVGHAGTLDPLASGVLVLLFGEATKLSPFLTADDKRYQATVVLGRETDTLDAAGVTVAEAAVPPLSASEILSALEKFRGETMQLAPVVSALKKDGVSLHARARRGEAVVAPTRKVVLHSSTLALPHPTGGVETQSSVGVETQFSVELHVGKGFYVRSLARDLAIALGTRGHVGALRRTASGAFTLADAISADSLRDETKKDVIRAALVGLTAACLRAMPGVALDEAGVADARSGRVVVRAVDAPSAPHVALLDAKGELVAVAEPHEGAWRVVRGFAATLTA